MVSSQAPLKGPPFVAANHTQGMFMIAIQIGESQCERFVRTAEKDRIGNLR
jgi:hypothetical protein